MLLSLNNNSLGLRMTNPGKKTLSAALASIFFTVGLGAGVNAYGAGLGRLTVSSALGQPLVAEIELVSLLPGEFESLSAKVASPDAYRIAKIEYSSVLRLLKFVPEMRTDGKPVLRVTSTAPVSEPFVDVLVEMVWPSGKLLREYPILLDPPGFSEAKVSQAPVSGTAKVAAGTAAPVVATPVTPSTAPAGKPLANPPTAAANTYGPVVAGETLSKIAASVKPESVSLEQMLVALYRENKDAFSGNVNRLKKGQILRVPSAIEAGQIPVADARKELSVQVANWREYREKVANDVSASPAKSGTSAQATGKIGGAKPDVAPAVAVGKDALKISKSDTNAATGGAGSKGGTSDQLNALREESIAKDNRLKEANSRVADLEKQIATMKQLIDAKGLVPPKAADTKVAKVEPAKVEPPKVEPAKVEPPKAVAAVPPAKADPAKDAKAEPAKVDVAKVEPAKTEPAKTEPVKTDPPKVDTAKVDMPKPAAPKVALKAPPKPEPSMMDDVIDNLPIIGGGALGIGLLGGIGFWLSKRKKKSAKGESSSAIKSSSVMPDDLKPNTVTGNRAGGLVDTGNSSFLTDFDKAAPGAVDTDDVDPVAEADVYIAYGRDAQAETILKEAMERDKGRHEIAVKLLEIYHARKSAASFEGVALQLRGAVGDGHPMWARACAMGSQIDPANPLYNSAANALGATGAFAAASSVAAASTSNPPSLDFDLGFDDKATNDSATIDLNATNPGVQMPAAVMDFDLDLGFNDDADKTVVANPAKAAAASSMLDFDLGFGDAPAAAPAPAVAKPAAAASSFDFDLSSLNIDVPADSDKTQRLTKPEAAAMAPKPAAPSSFAGMSLDLGNAPAASAENAGAAATKIELAKAYVEIGDKDGAKEILNEVIREGNAAQQAEAKQIIAGM
jgi:pilus assembly protein FimV